MDRGEAMTLSHDETDWDAFASAVDEADLFHGTNGGVDVDPIWLPTLPVAAQRAREASQTFAPPVRDSAEPAGVGQPNRVSAQPMPQMGRPPAVAPGKPKRPPRTKILLGLAFVAGWAALGWVLLISSAPTPRSAPFTAVTKAYPTTWDARVTDLAAFVESHRGLQFKHPVDVEFLSDADYVALFRTDAAADDSAAKAEIAAAAEREQNDAEALDAEGLAPATYDPVAASTTVAQTTTLGFFDPGADKVFVRGETMTPALRVVLVHELTHVLQSQWFSLRVGGDNDLDVRAVVEADAIRIQDEYQATLPKTDQDQARTANGATPATEQGLADVPDALVDRSYAPYILGPMFLKTVADKGGNAAVDKLFTRVPGDRDLVTPSLYSDAIDEIAVPVAAPAGSVVVHQPHLWSMFEALSMLDAWLPWRDARTPFDTWTGGGYVSYRTGDPATLCFTAAAHFSSSAGAAAFRQAVSEWASASGSTAAPTTENMTVQFEACQRPKGAPAPPQAAFSTAENVMIEHALLGDQSDPSSPDAAIERCVARRLIDDPAMAPLFVVDTLSADQHTTLDQERNVARWTCTSEADNG